VFGKRSDQPRTAEDRARAAAERAARRRGGSGRALPPEAFEYTVRPPDVEPHEPFGPPPEQAPPAVEPREEAPPAAEPVADAPPAVEPREEAPPAVEPREEAPPAVEPREEAPPVAEPREEAPPAVEPRDEAPPVAEPRDEAPPVAEPREEALPVAEPREEAPPAIEPRDEPPPLVEPRDEAPPAAEPREEAPPAAEPAPAQPAPDDEALAAERAARAAEARALRENAGAAQPDLEPTPEVIHQPTVEYTPFQTDEHTVPLGEPRDDEPRLVAARGFPREDEIHAYAGAPRPETKEHEAVFEEADEPPARPAVPLRKAPDRPPEAAAARRRPAPDQPRRRPPAPKTPKGPRGSGGSHWGRRIFTLIVVLLFAAVLYAFNKTFQPFHGDGSGAVAVTIPENSDAADVAKVLAAKGVVDSARYFELNATISGERGKLRPGRYTLKKGMTNGAAIDALTTPPAEATPVPTVDVTLVEGPSIKENDPVVKKSKKVDGSYAKAADSAAVLKRIRDLGAPEGTKTAEGFLFPATYKLPVGSPASDLVNEQLDAFKDNFDGVSMKYAKSKKLSRYDVLIIASMVEREAQLPRERKLVAAVIYNRLKQGMTLGIDATTRYATNNWQRPIKQSELDKPGPYNTRLTRGLPPTPIGNPGLASIKAAAKPSTKKYLYYVRKPGKSGEHAFSSTDAQFEKDVAKYQASRDGG
jgi:UPF0755 protein